MDIKDFLDTYLEGYLLGDLHSMSEIQLAPGQKFGAAGYPMVASALAGIELLGNLSSTKPFDPKRGSNDRFSEFWREIYSGVRADLGPAVYQLVRHGLAHVSVAKPLIVVQKRSDASPFHLHLDPDGNLIIDALSLAKDFEATYITRIKSRFAVVQSTMQQRLDEMLTWFTTQSLAQQIKTFSAVPSVHSVKAIEYLTWNASTASPSGGTFITSCNSPAPPTKVTP